MIQNFFEVFFTIACYTIICFPLLIIFSCYFVGYAASVNTYMRVAESVLFAGKAVRVPNPFLSVSRFYISYANAKGSQKVQGFTRQFLFQKEPLVDLKLSGLRR
ncbi:hypothetical protein CDL15_Pgr021941 [Punica granatum]|uniref:Uncharacterized protein n=1 Tax=Punica granatum TaxID=22663 RepID=A0A218W2L1_PUNGR|nr:hypothetical protein CDL15_Pgr021941 [Punica granatum]